MHRAQYSGTVRYWRGEKKQWENTGHKFSSNWCQWYFREYFNEGSNQLSYLKCHKQIHHYRKLQWHQQQQFPQLYQLQQPSLLHRVGTGHYYYLENFNGGGNQLFYLICHDRSIIIESYSDTNNSSFYDSTSFNNPTFSTEWVIFFAFASTCPN